MIQPHFSYESHTTRTITTYIAPKMTIDKFINMVQKHCPSGYESANGIRTRMYKNSQDEITAKMLETHINCMVITQQKYTEPLKIIKVIDINTSEAI